MTQAIALDHQDHYDNCCFENIEATDGGPEFYDNGVAFPVRCSVCGKVYHENYMLVNLSDPANDHAILTEY